MPLSEKILVLDFGSQYSQLIARRIREAKVYSQIIPFNTSIDEIRRLKPSGIILSGGPASVYSDKSPQCDEKLFKSGIPLLGICYGLQLMIHKMGGKIAPSKAREFGKAALEIKNTEELFRKMSDKTQVWMSHGDKVQKLPPGFKVDALTSNTEYAAISDSNKKLYGIQFHPEVVHTPCGNEIIKNFCHQICGCSPEWTMKSFLETKTEEIRETVKEKNVVLGLSGGVDSSVAAALIHKAIGQQLNCIFVNNGVLRLNEAERVKQLFQNNFNMNLNYIDASDNFLEKLSGINDPEQKRKIIGHEFIEIFNREASEIPNVSFLAQGTTYPDVIESIPIDGNPSAMIKSHHNVGGLPEKMHLELLEPLSRLFKDEVRELGKELELPEELVMRQPFPGPGLGVRILGEVNAQRVEILQKADAIVVEEIKKADLYYKIWQTFAVLLPVKTVGVMGDERTYENVCAVRAVQSTDGMTADWVQLPHKILGTISNRIINEVRGINRVVYDITSKPPGTIEWE